MPSGKRPKGWLEWGLDLLFGFLADKTAEPSGSDVLRVGFHKEISSTGYSVDKERERKVSNLKALCEEVVNDPDMLPSDVDGDGDLDTKCNWANARVAVGMGCTIILRGMRATSQIAMARGSSRFRIGTAEEAIAHARDGGYGFAGRDYSDSSHVAAIYPASGVFSGSWGILTPMLANVGKHNGIMGASKAFTVSSPPPEYFLWIG